MGAFSYHRFIFLLVCTAKTAIEVERLCVSASTLVGLLRFSQSFLFVCAAINRVNLAFRTEEL